eukprot:8295648-Prorocentrum_lima.AAC.1
MDEPMTQHEFTRTWGMTMWLLGAKNAADLQPSSRQAFSCMWMLATSCEDMHRMGVNIWKTIFI